MATAGIDSLRDQVKRLIRQRSGCASSRTGAAGSFPWRRPWAGTSDVTERRAPSAP